MNIHENIIALLQGELIADYEIAKLLQDLLDSPENRLFFRDQIAIMNGYDLIIAASTPSLSSSNSIMNRINEYELKNFDDEVGTDRSFYYKISNWSWLLGCIVALFLGFFARDLIDSGSEIVDSDQIEGVKRVETKSGYAKTTLGTNSDSIDKSITELQMPSNKEKFVSVQRRSAAKERLDVYPKVGVANMEPDSVSLLFPNEGGVYVPGSRIVFGLSSKREKNSILLEFSSDGGVSWNSAQSVFNNDYLSWLVPDDVKLSSSYLFRVSDKEKSQPRLQHTFATAKNTNCVAISPDGRLMAIGQAGINPVISVIDLKTNKTVHVLTGHRNSTILVKFNFDGSKLVSGSIDSTAIIWDVNRGIAEKIFNGQRGRIWPAVFNPNGKTIATGNDEGSVTIWDVESGSVIKTIDIHSEAVRYLEYTSDGKWLLAASTDGTASIFESQSGNQVQMFFHHVPDTTNLSNLSMEQYKALLRKNVVNGIQVLPDYGIAVTCGYDGLVKYWDINSGALIRSQVYHEGNEVSELLMSPDGKWMASVGYDGSTKIIDPFTGAIALNIQVDSLPMTRCAFTPDSKQIAITHSDGRITLWSMPTQYVDLSNKFLTIVRPDYSQENDIE